MPESTAATSAFRVGDVVRDRVTNGIYAVTHVDLDGSVTLHNGERVGAGDLGLFKAAGPSPSPDPVDTRVDALEARASRHLWHLTRLTGVITALGDRVDALETADRTRPGRVVLPADVVSWEWSHAEYGEPPPALLGYRVHGDRPVVEITIPPDMPSHMAAELSTALTYFAEHLYEWARMKSEREDSE